MSTCRLLRDATRERERESESSVPLCLEDVKWPTVTRLLKTRKEEQAENLIEFIPKMKFNHMRFVVISSNYMPCFMFHHVPSHFSRWGSFRTGPKGLPQNTRASLARCFFKVIELYWTYNRKPMDIHPLVENVTGEWCRDAFRWKTSAMHRFMLGFRLGICGPNNTHQYLIWFDLCKLWYFNFDVAIAIL